MNELSTNIISNRAAMPLFRLNYYFLRVVLYQIILVSFFYGTASQAQSQEIQIEKNLRKGHPRLIFTKADQLRIESLAKQDAFLQKLIENLFDQANQFLSEPTVKYELVGSTTPRLLFQSRACLSKISTLSTAYRLSGDVKYAQRAIKEIRTVIAFPDWNPSHFLDVAEMGIAVAIGYDWLYDLLSPEDKKSIKSALIKYALEPGLSVHPDRFRNKVNNWNLTCNGGLVIAALAIADEEPLIAEKIIRKALNSLPNALQNYAPDGAWFEGPSYWMSGTNNFCMMLSSMRSALGTDYGLSESSGLANTGDFFIDAIGPSGKFFNYADGGELVYTAPPALLLFAQLYKKPLLAWYNYQIVKSFLPMFKKTGIRGSENLYRHRLFALEIVWYTPGSLSNETILPLNTFYRGQTDVAFFRSSWKNDALWVGFKAGKNSLNHAHLDCGSFVFETDRHRWAEDLGDDEYNLPGYFDMKSDSGRRWNYFRTSSFSHNVPTINNQNQKYHSDTRIIAFDAGPKHPQIVADLSTAYEGQAKSVKRGLEELDGKALLVQDEVVALQQGDQFRWAMLTSAKVTLNGNRADLQIDDDFITAEIIQPAGATFDTLSTKPTYDANESSNSGTRLLIVSVPLEIDEINTVAIVLKSREKTPSLLRDKIKITPLSKWKGYFKSTGN